MKDKYKSEGSFQADLKKELRTMFPGCIVLKNDPSEIQGIPDLVVCYEDKYAFLECKESENAPFRPNQEYYVDKLNDMSFARTIYPENCTEVLKDLSEKFKK